MGKWARFSRRYKKRLPLCRALLDAKTKTPREQTSKPRQGKTWQNINSNGGRNTLMKKPRRKQVRNETFKLLAQHGATGWRVRFNPRLTRALGRCIYNTKTIEYQPKFMDENDWDEVVMTIRHEVAHALSPSYAGHGAIWRAKCLELGGNGKQYNTTANLSKKFKGTCPNCGETTETNRRTRSACAKCCNAHAGGLFSPQYMFIWTRN